MAKAMLYLRKFRQNSDPVWAKMMANLFRRGISEYITYNAQVSCIKIMQNQAYDVKTGGYSAENGIS
jgi:hypothetical protein